MKYIFHSNEKGSTLIISVLVLLLLTVIGIAATNTSTIEILISGNDKLHKMAFHQADGGAEVGIELVEQNIYMAGFNNNQVGAVNATNLNLYMNGYPGTPPFTASDAYYGGNGTRTNLRVGGNPELSTGSAIQMAAGYERSAKGAAGGGGEIVYDIWSQHIGVANSKAMIFLQWIHDI